MNDISSELLYMIFEHVYEKEGPWYSIKSCSLVSRTWHDIAVKFLFQRVTFRISLQSVYTPDFVDFISNCDQIHGTIRAVQLEVLKNDLHCPVTLERSIQLLLSRLTRLQSLSIYRKNSAIQTLDLGVFSRSFLEFLSQLKTRLGISIHGCDTYDDSALLLPKVKNLRSLGVQLSIADRGRYDWRARSPRLITRRVDNIRRRDYRVLSDSEFTGSRCLSKVLKHNPQLEDLNLRLGVGINRGWDFERSRWFSAFGSQLVKLKKLTLSGKLEVPSPPGMMFEQLESLTLTGKNIATSVIENMCGCFPILTEIQISTREVPQISPSMLEYYGGSNHDIKGFFGSLQLKRLAICGFNVTSVVEILLCSQTSLSQFECYDFDMFSVYLPNPPPDLSEWTHELRHGQHRVHAYDDNMHKRTGSVRWPALKYLQAHQPNIDFSALHENALAQIFEKRDDQCLSNLSTLGLDVERVFLITDLYELYHTDFEEDDGEVNQFDEDSRQVLIKKDLVPKLSEALEQVADLTANFSILNQCSSFSNVEEINIHLSEISPQKYWHMTAREAIHTFSYIWSRKAGKALLRLYIADHFCSVRYLIRYIGSSRAIVTIMHAMERPKAQLWQIQPVDFIQEVAPDLDEIRETWALNVERLNDLIGFLD